MDSDYKPNHIPVKQRVGHLVTSIVLLAYGGFGVWVNDLYVPAKNHRGVHLHDMAAWTMAASIVCVCLLLLSVVVDHYDKRNNEMDYERAARVFQYGSLVFFALSLTTDIVGREGGWAKAPTVALAFALFAIALVWTLHKRVQQDRQDNLQLAAWRRSEAKEVSDLATGHHESRRFVIGKDAVTVQHTEREIRYENVLAALSVDRILRDASGEYFYWLWRSDGAPYLKHTTQVNARIILKDKYQEPPPPRAGMSDTRG